MGSTGANTDVGGGPVDSINGIRIFTGQPLRSAMFDSGPVEAVPVSDATVVPATAIRWNVTQRRSIERER